MDERLRALLDSAAGSTAAKAAATYYVVAAVGLYRIFGRLSGPNPKLQNVALRDLDGASSSLVAGSGAESPSRPQQPQSSSSSSSQAPMKRKLSFLRSNPAMLEHNPFMNLTWEVTSGERVKCALLGPLLMPPRILLLVTCVFTAYFWGRLSCIGGVDLNKPLPYWRIVLQKPMKLCGRGIMLALGFLHIKVKGKKASPDEAPIVVSNHISFVETVYLPSRLLGMAVSRVENSYYPIFGTLMQVLQTVFVSRTDKDSRATVAKEIERRTKTERGQWHRQLLIFPEGTTTNGTGIITFKAGAFSPGMPVQPVVLRYTNSACDPSWVTGGPGPGEIALRMLCQPFNSMQVHFLPVYHPSPEEQKDAILYANNVRKVMAETLGVRPTEHGFEDVLLQCEAKKLGYQGSLKECVVELKSLKKILEIDLDNAKQYLQSFAALDAGKTGRITYQDFTKVFHSKDTEELRDFFSILDIKDRGSINFAEYLVGIAMLNEQGTDRFDGAMKLAFKIYDSSGEGKGLSKFDLSRLLRRVCTVEVSDELVHQTFETADLDADGLLSCDEFLVLARQHKEEWGSFKTSLFR